MEYLFETEMLINLYSKNSITIRITETASFIGNTSRDKYIKEQNSVELKVFCLKSVKNINLTRQKHIHAKESMEFP